MIAQKFTLGGALSSDTTSDAFLAVKQGIEGFETHSKFVMATLDEIGKFHPFIQGKLVIGNDEHHSLRMLLRQCLVCLRTCPCYEW